MAMLIQGRIAEQEGVATPITYEDHIWMWSGDININSTGRNRSPLIRSFSLPDELNAYRLPELNMDLLQKILAAYHRDTDGPRFRVFSSGVGFHIVPMEVRDATGRLVSISPLLDMPIAVPVESRAPSGHLAAICEALTAASGIRIISGARDFDQYFAPNGIVPAKYRQLTDNEKKLAYFAWGTDANVREALISLVEPSATTMTWNLRCDPDVDDWGCVLNLNPIQIFAYSNDVISSSITVRWDRKTPQYQMIQGKEDVITPLPKLAK
jgi:hypothetical protein